MLDNNCWGTHLYTSIELTPESINFAGFLCIQSVSESFLERLSFIAWGGCRAGASSGGWCPGPGSCEWFVSGVAWPQPPTSQYLVPVNLTQNVSQILLVFSFRALPAELKHVTITTYVTKWWYIYFVLTFPWLRVLSLWQMSAQSFNLSSGPGQQPPPHTDKHLQKLAAEASQREREKYW